MYFFLISVISQIVLFSPVCILADCGGSADVIFAVPGSRDIPGEEFFPFEKFLVMLVDYFKIDIDHINIGLILYGKEPIAISWPQPLKDQTQTNTRISLLTQRESYARKLSGTSDIPAAMQLMRHMFRNPSGYPLQQPRPGTKQIGVMFTYGSVSNSVAQDIMAASNENREAGIYMYAVGSRPNGQWFPDIATNPCNVFSMDSFSEGLRGLLPYIGSSVCTGKQRSIELLVWENPEDLQTTA